MPKHIMVFNDTQEILDLFKEILSGEGYEVQLYSFNTQELEAVRRAQPDLVIADCPPLTREERGWQLIQKLKMSADTEHIPIVIATTNLNAIEDSQGWLATKGILSIAKPFTMDELLQAVRQQIGAPDSEPGPAPTPTAETESTSRNGDKG